MIGRRGHGFLLTVGTEPGKGCAFEVSAMVGAGFVGLPRGDVFFGKTNAERVRYGKTVKPRLVVTGLFT